MNNDGQPSLPPLVSDDVSAARRHVAEQARMELLRAGLPAAVSANKPIGFETGALITAFDDEGPDVYVDWHVTQELVWAWLGPTERDGDGINAEVTVRRLAEIVESGESPPMMRHSGRVKELMMGAIIGILQSAGLDAQPANNDYYPFAVEITCR
jgi:hypothetical protein